MAAALERGRRGTLRPLAAPVSGPVVRPPKQITFASLCCRANRAVVSSWTTAARTPRTLFAAIEIPMPVPHTASPIVPGVSTVLRPTAAP